MTMNHPPETGRIIAAVSESFGVHQHDILGSARTQRAAVPRQIVCHLLRKCTVMTLAAIGEIFGRDHTTVLYSVRAAKKKIAANPYLAKQVVEIEEGLDAPAEESVA